MGTREEVVIPRALQGVVDPNCQKCGLHRFRKNVVAGRGSIPAELLLIGEAPGRSEDLQGTAFFGKSGRILNAAMEKALAWANLDTAPSMYITNICACRPTDEMYGENRKPTKEEAAACNIRMCGTVIRVKPLVLVFMGEVAKKYGKDIPKEVFDGPRVEIMHPMHCGYHGGVNGPLFRPLIQSLVTALDAVVEERERRENGAS